MLFSLTGAAHHVIYADNYCSAIFVVHDFAPNGHRPNGQVLKQQRQQQKCETDSHRVSK